MPQVSWLPGHLHPGFFPPVATDCLCGACCASPGLLDRDTHPRVARVSGPEGKVTPSSEGSQKALWKRVRAELCGAYFVAYIQCNLIRYDVDQEMEIIQSNLAQLRREAHRRTGGAWQRFVTQPEIYKPFFIIIMLSVIQQFSGISILR